MIFYLGEEITDKITDKERLNKNKVGYWDYGYSEELDTVIISRDGTLGKIFNIMGLNIGLPEIPKDKTLIINSEKAKHKQKWERHEMPQGLNEETMHQSKYAGYISREFDRRFNGVWAMIKGEYIFIPGTYYLGLQWVRENKEYPNFRVIQNELMIFWEACKADERCYGMDYVKNRRFGASFLGILEQIDAGTVSEDKILGIISKKGTDSKKIFRRLVKCFRRLPCFFLPVWDGTNNPKTELVLEEPTKRKKAGEKISEGDGLGTVISWHNTEINAMDGEEIYRSLLDESGKYPKEVPFSEYWYIVKTSHRLGSNIVGKSMVVSTVNAMSKGGSEFFKIWKDSDCNKRNANGQTKSGLYRIFIAAKYCLEGFFDEYGFSIVENPDKPVKNDLGKYIKIGSREFLKNELEALKDDPEKYNEFLRQFPDSERDAFRDESGDCAFNLIKIQEQIEHNEFELNDDFSSKEEFRGNDDLERGNLQWEGGIKDTRVVWRPDKENGRWFIKKGCHPPEEFKNKYAERMFNGVMAKSPLAGHIGSIGIDPYNRSKTSDGRGSFGSCHLETKDEHTCMELPKGQLILEYIARPRTVEQFFEDMIMTSFYYSMPFLCELSNERFLAMVKDRGYRHFSMNNPFKLWKDLSPTEKEFGGAPQQDAKIADAQFYTVESAIEDKIGVARDNNNRPIGDMGDFPFTRTLYQFKEVDPNNRTKFDAYISYSLARLGNQKKSYKVVEVNKPVVIPFETYNNQGQISKRTA